MLKHFTTKMGLEHGKLPLVQFRACSSEIGSAGHTNSTQPVKQKTAGACSQETFSALKN
jgi:hypothetical protein